MKKKINHTEHIEAIRKASLALVDCEIRKHRFRADMGLLTGVIIVVGIVFWLGGF